MKLVFTKSDKLLSVVIRKVTGQCCSHFLFVFDNGLAFEANLLGTRPVFWKTDMPNYTIMHQVTIPVHADIEKIVWDEVINKYSDKKYDYPGFFYVGLWLIYQAFMRKVFKHQIKMPERNKWSRPGSYFCDELYDAIGDLGVDDLPNLKVSGSMKTPHDLAHELMEWLKQNGRASWLDNTN